MIGRMAALSGALMMQLAVTTAASGATCEQDVADLERVMLELTMPTDLRREAEGLQEQARALCESGDQAEASSKVDEAWNQILASDEVAASTVAELATGSCQEGVALVRAREDGTDAGELGRAMAERLIADAEQLCAEDERILAEEKLSMAMSILGEE